ncbi:MAG: helix-turn-helix transcriptional regulator [Sporichthyaceae bacterium]
MLSLREYRSVLSVLRECEEADGTDEFRAIALRAIHEHLGYERLTFYLGMHPSVRLALRDPVTVGVPKPVIDSYLSRFAVLDPFGADHGRGLFCVDGMAGLPQVLDSALTPAHEEYLADFLDPTGITDKVMLWLDTELPVHGFLGVIAAGDRAFDKRDREMLDLLRPHLTYMLRAHLRQSPQPDTGSLTTREHEVARLVADGWSNRAIARHLDICEGTVKKHITRVLTKSDVRSRTELAVRWRTGV